MSKAFFLATVILLPKPDSQRTHEFQLKDFIYSFILRRAPFSPSLIFFVHSVGQF